MLNDVYLENRVLAADGVELIHLLYEHAVLQVKTARASLASRDITGRSKAVTKTLAILGELEGSLDYAAGGSISQNLGRLYQYMRRKLMEGSLKQQDESLAEVESLLQTLNEGWTAMRRNAPAPVRWQASQQPSPFVRQNEDEEEVSHSWSA